MNLYHRILTKTENRAHFLCLKVCTSASELLSIDTASKTNIANNLQNA